MYECPGYTFNFTCVDMRKATLIKSNNEKLHQLASDEYASLQEYLVWMRISTNRTTTYHPLKKVNGRVIITESFGNLFALKI